MKPFIELEEFVCLKYLPYLSTEKERADYLTKVLASHGFDIQQVMKYAEDNGYLDEKSRSFIGSKEHIRNYFVKDYGCTKEIRNKGVRSELAYSMCSLCARSGMKANYVKELESRVISYLYGKKIKKQDAVKPDIKYISSFCTFYEKNSELMTYSLRSFVGKAIIVILAKKTMLTGNAKNDALVIAESVLAKDKTGFGTMEEQVKQVLTKSFASEIENIISRECSEEEFGSVLDKLTVGVRTGELTLHAFTTAYDTGSRIWTDKSYGDSWEVRKKTVASASAFVSDTEYGEAEDIEEHKRRVRELAQAQAQMNEKSAELKTVSEEAPAQEPAATKEPEEQERAREEKKKDIKHKEPGSTNVKTSGDEPDKKLLSKHADAMPNVVLDDNEGMLLDEAWTERIFVPKSTKEAAVYLRDIYDSFYISAEFARLGTKEGLLVYSEEDGRIAFLGRDVLVRELVEEIFDVRTYMLHTMNAVLLFSFALSYGVRNFERCNSLRALWQAGHEDENRIYPTDEIFKTVFVKTDGTGVADYINEVFIKYGRINSVLVQLNRREGKEKPAHRYWLYESVLASSFEAYRIYKFKGRVLKRESYKKNSFFLPDGLKKSGGGKLVKVYYKNKLDDREWFSFFIRVLTNIFRRAPFSSMNIRWAVLDLVPGRFYLWTHIRNTDGVMMVEEAIALAFADAVEKMSLPECEISFEEE